MEDPVAIGNKQNSSAVSSPGVGKIIPLVQCQASRCSKPCRSGTNIGNKNIRLQVIADYSQPLSVTGCADFGDVAWALVSRVASVGPGVCIPGVNHQRLESVRLDSLVE